MKPKPNFITFLQKRRTVVELSIVRKIKILLGFKVYYLNLFYYVFLTDCKETIFSLCSAPLRVRLYVPLHFCQQQCLAVCKSKAVETVIRNGESGNLTQVQYLSIVIVRIQVFGVSGCGSLYGQIQLRNILFCSNLIHSVLFYSGSYVGFK